MDDTHFGNALQGIVGPGQIRPNAPLAPLTTFRVGGAADWLVEAKSVEQLAAVLQQVFAGSPMSITADARANAVLVRGPTERLTVISGLLNELDSVGR